MTPANKNKPKENRQNFSTFLPYNKDANVIRCIGIAIKDSCTKLGYRFSNNNINKVLFIQSYKRMARKQTMKKMIIILTPNLQTDR